MFSKALQVVRLTGIFFIFYISATSATPTGQPGEVQNINDDIHARAGYNPYLCIYPYAWLRRECVGAISVTAWRDICIFNDWSTQFQTLYDNKAGNCPQGTVCLDGVGTYGSRTINCVSNDKSNGKRKSDAQSGTSDPKRARTELGNTQVKYSVTLDHDVTKAAVAAVLQSGDGSFLIAPNNVIVGNVHGKIQQVCKGDKSSPTKARECYPNGTYDLKAGQTIDFTWGMSGEQEGKLVYGIVPVPAA